MRRILTAGVVVVLLAGPAVPATAAVPAFHPSRLRAVGDARQVLVVTGKSWRSSYATLRAYERDAAGVWRQQHAGVPARLGWAGWSWGSRRVQGNGTTPAGTFRITTAFGLAADPGTALPYTLADRNDRWVGDNRDPRTYNMLQPFAARTRTWRAAASERLAGYPRQYEYAAVIDFNRPAASTIRWDDGRSQWVTSSPADVRRGSAIFLHVNGRGSTAGCVSLRRADLLRVLRWLDPALRPRIVLAPLGSIGRA